MANRIYAPNHLVEFQLENALRVRDATTRYWPAQAANDPLYSLSLNNLRNRVIWIRSTLSQTLNTSVDGIINIPNESYGIGTGSYVSALFLGRFVEYQEITVPDFYAAITIRITPDAAPTTGHLTIVVRGIGR